MSDDCSRNGYYGHSRPELLRFLRRHGTWGGRALDVGCGRGLFGQSLLADGGFGEVWGVEPDLDAASAAAAILTRVINGTYPNQEALDGSPFDLVVFADSLEHMIDPWAALCAARASLGPHGYLLASIPNVGHYSVIWDLIRGRWIYTPEGLLDRSHLRFFTPTTSIQALRDSGFELVVRDDVEGTLGGWLRPAVPLIRYLSPNIFVVQTLLLTRLRS